MKIIKLKQAGAFSKLRSKQIMYSSLITMLKYYFSFIIIFCNQIKPYINASAVGGHPGTYTSTGITLSQPRRTEYE